MKAHFTYLRYLLRHKWFVLVACWRVGLYWRGLRHDWHKFLPSEWFPYVEHFHGRAARAWRDKTGYYKPTDTGDPAFDFAWLLHSKRADHHWQWWTTPDDTAGIRLFPMAHFARIELLCDWWGASMAQGKGGWSGVHDWYDANAGKMQLHPSTRAWIDRIMRTKAGDWTMWTCLKAELLAGPTGVVLPAQDGA